MLGLLRDFVKLNLDDLVCEGVIVVTLFFVLEELVGLHP